VGKEEEGQGGGRWKGEEARKGEWMGGFAKINA